MMRPYPFFYFPPFQRPSPYYSNFYPPRPMPANSAQNKKNMHEFSYPSSSFFEGKEKQAHSKTPNSVDISSEDECFEIFGLKLHFDDLLLIALLFFLYEENVKDTYLYIALILLLLS